MKLYVIKHPDGSILRDWYTCNGPSVPGWGKLEEHRDSQHPGCDVVVLTTMKEVGDAISIINGPCEVVELGATR